MSRPDPNIAQRQASDPECSVWVAANAGSGKTKVLTDRVLRLLLAGTLPSRILCITYTRAAATEMQDRIFRNLSEWAVIGDDDLRNRLEALTGKPPHAEQLRLARRLFTELLETSPTLRVQTIHAFCQSLLARFPLEAGIPPHFSVLDERSADELLNEAKLRLLGESDESDPEVADAIAYYIEEKAERSFHQVLSALVKGRRRMSRMLECPGGRGANRRTLRQALNVAPQETRESLFERHLGWSEEERQALIRAAELGLDMTPGKDIVRRLGAIRHHHRVDMTPARLAAYLSDLGNADGTIPAQLYLKALQKSHPLAAAALDRERERLGAYREARLSYDAAERGHHLTVLAEALFGLYETLKRRRGMLDYDDLILRARRLLCDGERLAWVLFKLDGGLSHLLLDEAQDTAPEQWEIARALSAEFFAGQGAVEGTRTFFIVGDRKQSIFRFQGAEPEQFAASNDDFKQRATDAGLDYREVSLDISFRSTQAILDAVDATFAPLSEAGRFTLTGTGRHLAYREGQAGVVECWPLVPKAEKAEKVSAWEIGRALLPEITPERRLAERIAATIGDWRDQGRSLAASGRRITPGDILILLRSRGRIGTEISRALRERGVPVAGLDRLELTDDQAVRDVMALGAFTLLPEDDLNLAALLKSPLVGFGEEDLFTLAHGRDRVPLWEVLRRHNGPLPQFHDAAKWLAQCITRSQRRPAPSDFFAEILYAEDGLSRLVARLGEGARESLQSFLHQARLYEKAHTPSLQGFLHWMERGRSEIKRDMEHGGDAVRIMTVHGAKGLEAPIVFLPQMTQRKRGGNFRLLGFDYDNRPLMLPSVRKELETPLLSRLKQDLQQADHDEELRLLYVAMTRAKDELYLCGVAKEGREPDWYDYARAGMEALPGVASMDEEQGVRLRYVSGEAAAGPLAQSSAPIAKAAHPPAYMSTPVPHELPRRRVRNPSQLVESEPPYASPGKRWGGSTLSPAERGQLIHKLFEILAGLADAKRSEIGRRLLQANAPEAPDAEREEMLEHALLILRDPVYARVFGPDSLAEVAIAGTLEDGLPAAGIAGPLALSGQIDRLLIDQRDILVIDYKTGELPAGGAIPEAYRRQMEAYRVLLERLYPGRRVKCALLYTAVPTLLPVVAPLQAAA